MQPPENEEGLDLWIILGIVVVVLVVLLHVLYIVRRWIRGKSWSQPDLRMDQKVVIITGANSGIGKATALDLARRGARVYLACRSSDKGEAARLEIIKATDNQQIFYRHLNLASMHSIRQFVAGFSAEESRLDVLINNAGLTGPRQLTEDGFEMQIGVNHMGHFLLTNLLLDLLKKSAPSRILTLTSVLHRFGKINRMDLNSEKTYRSFCVYSNSKLANVLFTRELSKRLTGTGVTANSVNPGPVHSNFSRGIKFIVKILWLPVSYFLFKDAAAGAQTSIRVAVDPKLESVTGKYFSNCEEGNESRRAKNDDDARWLWEESTKWTMGKKV